MLRKRMLVLFSGLCLGASALAWSQRPEGFLRRLQARHVRDTAIVSGGHRPLTGFFDGVAPDPHFDARTSLEAARTSARPCRDDGGGLLARFASLFEHTVYA